MRKRILLCGLAANAVPSLFGFAPGGVCLASPVARSAVRSYRTLSPLLLSSGLLSVALSLELPLPDVIRRRVSVEPGLSSTRKRYGLSAHNAPLGSGHPANWHCE